MRLRSFQPLKVTTAVDELVSVEVGVSRVMLDLPRMSMV